MIASEVQLPYVVSVDPGTLSYALPADLKVRVADELHLVLEDGATQAIVFEPALSTHYSVAITYQGAATITFFNNAQLLSGRKLVVDRRTPRVQPVNFKELDAYPGQASELMGDRLVAMIQELDQKLSRSLLARRGESLPALPAVTALLNKLFWLNSSGTGWNTMDAADFAALAADLALGASSAVKALSASVDTMEELRDIQVQIEALGQIAASIVAVAALPAGAIEEIGEGLAAKVDAEGGDASLTEVDTFPTVSLPRGLRSRFGDVINIKDVKRTAGGGTGDDSGAIQDALDYAANYRIGNHGCTIVFPDGEYLMDAKGLLDMPGTSLGQRYHGVKIKGQGPFLTKLIANSTNADGLLDVSMWGSQARIAISDLQLVSSLPANATGSDNGTLLLVRNRSNTDSDPSDGIFSGRSVIIENIHCGADDEDTGNVMLRWGRWKKAIEIRHCLAPVVRNCTVVTPQKAEQAAGLISDAAMFAEAIHFRHCYLPYAYMNDVQGYVKRGIWCHGTLTSFGDEGRWEGGLITKNEVGACRDAIVISHDYTDDAVILPPLMMVLGNAVNALRNGVTVDKHSSVIIQALNVIARQKAEMESNQASGILLNDAAMVTMTDIQFDGDGWDNGDNDCFAGIRTTGETAYCNASSIRLHCDGVGWHNSNVQPDNADDTPRSLVLSDIHLGGKRAGARAQRKSVDTTGNLVVVSTSQQAARDEWSVESHIPGATADFSPVLNVLRKPNDYDSVSTGYGGRMRLSGLSSTGVERPMFDIRTRFAANANGAERADVWISQRINGANEDIMVLDSSFGGLISMKRQVVLPSYTVAGLPAPIAGGQVYVTNMSGGAGPAYADGTNWRRHSDGTIVS